jgi:hypothetical protein
MYDIETLKRTIASAERDTENMLQRYGTGVRPSWISADIAMNNARIARYTKMLAEAEANQGETK